MKNICLYVYSISNAIETFKIIPSPECTHSLSSSYLFLFSIRTDFKHGSTKLSFWVQEKNTQIPK